MATTTKQWTLSSCVSIPAAEISLLFGICGTALDRRAVIVAATSFSQRRLSISLLGSAHREGGASSSQKIHMAVVESLNMLPAGCAFVGLSALHEKDDNGDALASSVRAFLTSISRFYNHPLFLVERGDSVSVIVQRRGKSAEATATSLRRDVSISEQLVVWDVTDSRPIHTAATRLFSSACLVPITQASSSATEAAVVVHPGNIVAHSQLSEPHRQRILNTRVVIAAFRGLCMAALSYAWENYVSRKLEEEDNDSSERVQRRRGGLAKWHEVESPVGYVRVDTDMPEKALQDLVMSVLGLRLKAKETGRAAASTTTTTTTTTDKKEKMTPVYIEMSSSRFYFFVAAIVLFVAFALSIFVPK